MTKKELEELVKEQSKQISDLISLVQNQKKETIIVRESGGNKDWKPSQPFFPSPWTPTSPINPWVTYCGTGTGNYTSSSSTELRNKSTLEAVREFINS